MSEAPTRRLLALVAPWRGFLAAAFACTLVASALDGATLVLLMPLFKSLFGTTGALTGGGSALERALADAVAPLLAGLTREQQVARMVAVLLGVFLLKNACGYAASQLTVRTQESLVAELRSRVFRHLLALPTAFFERTRVGTLASSVVLEADMAKGVVTASLLALVRNLSLVLTSLAILAFLSWRLSLVLLLGAPPLILGLRAILRRLRRHARARAEERAQLTAQVTERLAAVRLVRTLGAAEAEGAQFAALARAYRKKVIRTQRFSSLTGPVTEAFTFAVVALVLYAATAPGLAGLGPPLAPEALILFLVAALRLMSPLKALSEFPVNWTNARASVDRVFALLDEPAAEVDPPGARPAAFARELAYERVGFAYGDGPPVLEDISFTVRPGQVVALVGPSGAGKTTLVDLLPRLHEPTRGRILLDGVPIAECTRASVRALLAVVSQDTVLFHDTVHANIAYGRPGAARAEVEAAARAANADGFIALLPHGYDTVLGERGTRLSGGQRQRVAIARALLRDAPILVLDEATSALDTESERLVQDAIDRLMAHRTVLVIAHRLTTIRSADLILVLDGGRIVQRGTHDELLAAGGLYRRLHDLQFRDAAAPALAAEG